MCSGGTFHTGGLERNDSGRERRSQHLIHDQIDCEVFSAPTMVTWCWSKSVMLGFGAANRYLADAAIAPHQRAYGKECEGTAAALHFGFD